MPPSRLVRLKVYRDIYYTRGQGRNAVDRPIQLAADEYFVLGDNSPGLQRRAKLGRRRGTGIATDRQATGCASAVATR